MIRVAAVTGEVSPVAAWTWSMMHVLAIPRARAHSTFGAKVDSPKNALSPRLSRGEFRRRVQARAAVRAAGGAESQGQALVLSQHARRRRAVRPGRHQR